MERFTSYGKSNMHRMLMEVSIPKIDVWLNIVTGNTKKIHLISWKIQNEIIELFHMQS